METYSFSHSTDYGINTRISFTIRTDGLHISSFSELCNRAAKAFGWSEQNADEYITPDENCTLLDDLIADDEAE